MESGDIAALVWLLVSVIVILGLAYWVTRRLAGGIGISGFRAGEAGRELKVLSQVPLGKEQRLLVIQAGRRYFLLGVTAAGMTMLAEFTEEEAELWKKTPEESSGKPDFRESFRAVLRQKGWR